MKRLALIALPVIVALVAANRVEHRLRVSGFSNASGSGLIVPLIEEESGGHVVLTVDDRKFQVPGLPVAAFSALEKWAYDAGTKNPPPGDVAALDGRQAAAAGFMFPLVNGAREASEFFLVPSGKFHDEHVMLDELPPLCRRIMVRAAAAVPVETVRPVFVKGRFKIDPSPVNGWIYVMDSAEVGLPAETPVSLSASDIAGVPWFDFFWLEEMGAQEARGAKPDFPPGLAALEGRKVAVEGWLFDRQDTTPPTLVAGKEWWNGCCEGEAPTYYNSLLVSLAASEQLPAHWTRRGSFVGILKLGRKQDEWKENGIARIEGAKSCPPLRVMRGAIAPPWLEAVALAAALAFLVRALFFGRKPECVHPKGENESGAATPGGGA